MGRCVAIYYIDNSGETGDEIIKHQECNRHILPVLFAIAFFCVNAAVLFSQERENVITDIVVDGLTRTRVHVVKNPLERFLGMEQSAFDENDVFTQILNLGVLAPVSAELIDNEDGVTLHVTVEEKWTTFPVPLVISGSGGSNFGLFMLESNAFGLRDMAVFGGMYGTNGWSAITMYNYNPRRGGMPGYIAFLMYGHQERESVDKNETAFRKYNANVQRYSLGINYPFGDVVTASFSVSFADIALEEIDTLNPKNELFNPPKNGATMLAFTPSLTLRKSDWDGYFHSQQSFTLRYNYNHALSGSSFHQVEFSGTYEQPLTPGLRLNVKSGGVWKDTDDPLFEEGPIRAHVAILPRNFSAMQYAGLSLGVERYLHKNQRRNISMQTLWQGVYYEGSIVNSEFNHGPAVGFHFYLNRVALPAMGLVFGYNIDADLMQVNFSVGMSF